MKFATFMERFSKFRLLHECDNEKAIEFFNSSQMKTQKLHIRYERSPDYFSFLSYQSQDRFVLAADKDENELKAIASVSVREGYFKSQKIRVAYLGDLRVRGGIKFSFEWQKLLSEIVHKSKNISDLNADIFVTAIMKGNQKAFKALVKNDRSDYLYQKICDYSMVNILMSFKKLMNIEKIDIRRANKRDEDELLEFLDETYQARQLGYTRQYFQRAFISWQGFSMESFIILKKNGKIKSTLATWNPSPAKKIILESLPISLKIMNRLLSPFTKTPKEKHELKVQYLNFMNLDQSVDLRYFLEFLRQEKIFRHFDVVAFADFNQLDIKKILKGTVYDKTALELYQVVSKHNKSNQLIVDSKNCIPFEISLV